MGRYIKGPISMDIDLPTLAGLTGLIKVTSDQVSEKARVTSVDCSYALSGWTASDNVGPLMVGVMHGDYTLVELEEWIELTTGWDEGDLVSREISSRKIRKIGIFDVPATAGEAIALNEGESIKTRLNWPLRSGQGLYFWVYNTGGSAVVTTVPNVHVQGHANIFPS